MRTLLAILILAVAVGVWFEPRRVDIFAGEPEIIRFEPRAPEVLRSASTSALYTTSTTVPTLCMVPTGNGSSSTSALCATTLVTK